MKKILWTILFTLALSGIQDSQAGKRKRTYDLEEHLGDEILYDNQIKIEDFEDLVNDKDSEFPNQGAGPRAQEGTFVDSLPEDEFTLDDVEAPLDEIESTDDSNRAPLLKTEDQPKTEDQAKTEDQISAEDEDILNYSEEEIREEASTLPAPSTPSVPKIESVAVAAPVRMKRKQQDNSPMHLPELHLEEDSPAPEERAPRRRARGSVGGSGPLFR